MASYERLSAMQATVQEIPEEFNVALLGGRGGGKTTAAMFLALAHVKKYGERANVLVARRTLKALQDFEDELLALLGQVTAGAYAYNKADKVARVIGAKIELTCIDDWRSYDKVQGSNRTMLIVDEVTQYPSERIIRLLRSNLRAPEGVQTRVVYCGNPGGPLHGLMFERHVRDRAPYVPYDIDLGDSVSETWVTVPSTVSDNPFVDGAAYIRRLREACHGDVARLRQWLFGDWAEGSGLMFPAWRDDIHQLAVPDGFTVNRDQFRFTTATDWGLTAPSVSLLGLIARQTVALPNDRAAPRGSLIVLDEVTDAIMDDPENLSRSREWPPARLGERIVSRCANYGVQSPSGVIDDARGLRGESLIEEMRVEGFWNLTKPRKGLRAEGWATIASMIQAAADNDRARPHLYVSPACRYLLATLPRAVRDEGDPDDIADTPNCPDHALDALRYLAAEARQHRGATSGHTIGMY